MFSSFDIASIINWFLEMPEMQVYLWVMLLMTIESSFIPFPSEIVVPPAAYLAANQRADIWLVLLFATIGAALGAIFNYVISWWLGRPIVYRFADSQLGHMCLINREKVEKAEKYFEEHGALATLIGRLVPVIRQLISIPAGLSKMHFGKFLLYTILGAGIWNSILATLGFVLGKTLKPEMFMAQIERYNSIISDVILILCAIGIGFLIWKTYRHKAKAKK